MRYVVLEQLKVQRCVFAAVAYCVRVSRPDCGCFPLQNALLSQLLRRLVTAFTCKVQKMRGQDLSKSGSASQR